LKTIEARLHVVDLPRTMAFYTGVLDFEVDAVFPDDNPVFAILQRDGVGLQLGGIGGTRAAEHPSTCTLWLDVEDVNAWHETLAARGPIEWGPEVYFYGRREFAVRDPEGNLVVLSEETDDPVTIREEP
jgi:uncharacterized glyoxalase superfamily protein PhnB